MELYSRCFVCNIKTDEWRSGLNGLMSQHSNTLITVLIRTILGNFNSARNIDDESNSICPDCLSRIEDCDWQRITAQHCERELYDVLVRTETQCSTQPPEITNPEATSNDKSSKFEVSPSVVETVEAVPNKSTAISDQSTSQNTGTHETNRFHAEVEGDDPEDEEIDDIDYDEEAEEMEDFDEEALEADFDPEYKTEHLSEDDEDAIGDYEEDEDGDWEDPNIKVKRKRGRPPKHPQDPNKAKRPKKTGEEGKRKCGRPSMKKSYDCQQCEQVFERYIDFQEHKRWHREQATPKFRCPKCHYISPDQEQCDTHVKLHETAEPLQCVICQSKYSDIRTLKKHIRVHMQLRDFVCHLCGKQFFRSMSLSIHMKYHLNIRTKQCPHCPMTFVESKNLNRHMKTHTLEKPYACSVCGRRFAHSYNVRPHERTHTERDVYRKFKCSFCNSAFDSKAKLATHMQKSHATVTPHLENTNKLEHD